MKIRAYRNTSKEKVETKQHNIWLGISLGNRYFNEQHLKDYIDSLLGLAKEKLLVIIADELQAINYEVFETLNPHTAFAKAQRNGQKVFDMVIEIIKQLPGELQGKIELVKWADISTATWYKERAAIFRNEFETSVDFQNRLIEIVRLNMGDRLEELSSEEVTKLAQYVLQELPIFIGAVSYNGTNYDLHVYPGLSLMDDFVLDLQDSKVFPQLIEQMQIGTPLAIAEAYAE